MFDYRLMEALAMVVEEGGFDRAAKRLYLTQSAVSQRVKQLEELAGQILLVRTTPPTPTEQGRMIIRHLRKVRRLEGDLRDDLELGDKDGFTSLPIGVNADSLSTWFIEAIHPYLKHEQVLLDLSIDDQEQTHRLMREGQVLACVSAESKGLQGCRVDYLGCMTYRLAATPEFADYWFGQGVTRDAVLGAPAILFTRHDTLHQQILNTVLGDDAPAPPFAHYLPDYDKFGAMITSGLAYGTLTRRQSDKLIDNGSLVDLAPGNEVEVHLYWHSWTIQSRLLERLRTQVQKGGELLLNQN